MQLYDTLTRAKQELPPTPGPIRIKGRIRVRFGGGKCFTRVVQPGRNFGGCVSRAVLKEKGLLK